MHTLGHLGSQSSLDPTHPLVTQGCLGTLHPLVTQSSLGTLGSWGPDGSTAPLPLAADVGLEVGRRKWAEGTGPVGQCIFQKMQYARPYEKSLTKTHHVTSFKNRRRGVATIT